MGRIHVFKEPNSAGSHPENQMGITNAGTLSENSTCWFSLGWEPALWELLKIYLNVNKLKIFQGIKKYPILVFNNMDLC
jgi:hypothetical protein